MNVSLLRDNKLMHSQERRGSRMSMRMPSRQPSMVSLRPHSPNPSIGRQGINIMQITLVSHYVFSWFHTYPHFFHFCSEKYRIFPHSLTSPLYILCKHIYMYICSTTTTNTLTQTHEFVLLCFAFWLSFFMNYAFFRLIIFIYLVRSHTRWTATFLYIQFKIIINFAAVVRKLLNSHTQ